MIATVIVGVLLATSCCLTLILSGVSSATLVVAMVHAFCAVGLAWYIHTTQGTITSRRVFAAIVSAAVAISRWVQSVIASITEWNRDRIDRKRQRQEEERLRAEEEARRRRAELERRKQEIANATNPVGTRWESRKGVNASMAITYGIGDQFVYCYTFPTTLKMADLTDSANYNIKVGMATNHPISRIREQVSASKTAMSESAAVLLIFQTDHCADLEKWMHSHLDRTPGSLGREWFVTNPDQLLRLFRMYVASQTPMMEEAMDIVDI